MTAQMQYKPQWIREDFVDFLLEKVDPMLALKRIKAQVISVYPLAADMYRIKLRPSHQFNTQQYRAGQSVLVTVVVEGVRLQRSYSIIAIDAGTLILGVKVQGRVSRAMSQLKKGEVIEISQPQGEFCLHAGQEPALLIASGSGITAIYALLQQAMTQKVRQIDLLYFSRDTVLHNEIQQLAEAYPQLNYHFINTTQQKQHLDLALLKAIVPHFAHTHSYACGTPGMMQAVQYIYHGAQAEDWLHQEYFQPVMDETLEAQPVRFIRSQQAFEAKGNLLDSAEQAGLRPAHGCRMGICNTCTCTKVSGSTRNLLTGEIDHGNNVQIKLCISQAVSPLEINL